jgi:D-beta-D-heptose 7-phosphate kinase/D-beta-D-heptose 1-phosphate adenosyltransferase
MTAADRGPLVVIGDSLLDVDLDGSSDRLCPDAPVPVMDLQRRRLRPGGAGLAALLTACSGTPVQLITGVGDDEAAETLLGLLRDQVQVLAQPLRGSTVTKTRIRVGELPLVRVDSGDGVAGGGDLTPAAVAAIRAAGAILVSDYGRGMAWQPDLRRLLADRPERLPIVWDPHPRGARPVPGATLLTPNLMEAQRVATGAPTGHARGADLCRRWQAAAVAVTLGEDGALLTQAGAPSSDTLPVPPQLVAEATRPADTCGAGDRFAGAAAQALRRGCTVRDAAEEAVEQAARFVTDGGAAGHSTFGGNNQVSLHPAISADLDVDSLIERTRRTGGRVVATGGCFDLLHRGHVTLLERAREHGDLLIVCLNSDASVRRAKGAGRPLVAERDRARVLSALAAVDGVVLFDEDTPAALLERIRPDIWVKGDDYTGRDLPEAPIVTRHGGRVVLLPLVSGYSTTRLVDASRPTPANA